MTQATDLTLKVTEERLRDLDLETFYYIDTSPRAAIDFVAHFVVGEDGEYLPKPQAVKLVLTGRKVSDINELAEELRRRMEETAVPNA